MDSVAICWNYILANGVERPVFSDRIWRKLVDARFQDKELLFFSPWGCKRYDSNLTGAENFQKLTDLSSEQKTLQEIDKTLDMFAQSGFNVRIMLMPADIYGIQINNFPEEFVRGYFLNLGSEIKNTIRLPTDVVPWSEIVRLQQPRYDALRKGMVSDLPNRVKSGEYERACKAARIFNPADVEGSAQRYCVERLVESQIIKETYDPVKLSLVRKEKDGLDGKLMRAYLINNKAPWMR